MPHIDERWQTQDPYRDRVQTSTARLSHKIPVRVNGVTDWTSSLRLSIFQCWQANKDVTILDCKKLRWAVVVPSYGARLHPGLFSRTVGGCTIVTPTGAIAAIHESLKNLRTYISVAYLYVQSKGDIWTRKEKSGLAVHAHRYSSCFAIFSEIFINSLRWTFLLSQVFCDFSCYVKRYQSICFVYILYYVVMNDKWRTFMRWKANKLSIYLPIYQHCYVANFFHVQLLNIVMSWINLFMY